MIHMWRIFFFDEKNLHFFYIGYTYFSVKANLNRLIISLGGSREIEKSAYYIKIAYSEWFRISESSRIFYIFSFFSFEEELFYKPLFVIHKRYF